MSDDKKTEKKPFKGVSLTFEYFPPFWANSHFDNSMSNHPLFVSYRLKSCGHQTCQMICSKMLSAFLKLLSMKTNLNQTA